MQNLVTAKENALATPQAVANFFLENAKKENRQLTPMQLNKLVYIAHGWVLALMDQPLIDEQIEAWQHGPVIPSLYHEFKHYGGASIDEPAYDYDPFSNQKTVPIIKRSVDPKLTEILEKVWKVYRSLSGTQLRNITHQKNSPWTQVYNASGWHIKIDDATIKAHYVELLKEMLSLGRR